MKSNHRISFIIPAYNSCLFLERAVESIFDGNYTDGDEVIIVNDGSTDNTQDIINHLKRRYNVIASSTHQFNKGSAAASRNTGIDLSSNELIFTLDADNQLLPGSISKLKRYLLKNKAGSAAFEGKFFFEENPKEITNRWYYRNKTIDLAYALSTRYWPGPSGNYLFTKESWLNAGRYNENVGGAIDSWAFGIKQLATGTHMVILPETYYLHKHGYESTYVRNENADNLNIRGLNVITEIYDLIDPMDIEYIFSEWGRTRWLTNLDRRPIKLKKAVKQNGFKHAAFKTKLFLKDLILVSH